MFVVERRRRDKMNEWIVHLSKMVPDCAQENNKAMKVSCQLMSNCLQKYSNGFYIKVLCEFIVWNQV